MKSPKPVYEYKIRVEGPIDPEWREWFGGMQISARDRETLLTGNLPDGPALLGVLTALSNLNLTLISVERNSTQPQE